MDPDEAITRGQGDALLEYAQLTYSAVTAWRRRLAAGALVMATIVGLMFAYSAARWVSTRSELAAVADDDLIDVVGVQIPDPRPALQRTQLRVVSLLWGFAAATSGGITLMFLALYALARPPGPKHRPDTRTGEEPP